MPLTLEQYASYLDTRSDLPWPAPPRAEPVKAKPHLVRLPGIKAVLWGTYGTLISVPQGELLFEHPQAFIMNNALDKTIQEFKMWGAMSRKPGQPAEYLGQVYNQILIEHQAVGGGGERFPEIRAEKIWEAILKRLLQKDYKFDAGFFGSLNEYAVKVAYFFHASLQGTACPDGAAAALKHVRAAGLHQGILGDGQCFSTVQLQRGLAAQDRGAKVDELLDGDLTVLSCDLRGKKPSERLFRHALDILKEHDLAPAEVLHVGSRIANDLVPARRLGMRTGLFAGDKASLQATPEQLKDPGSRPDVLLTNLEQITDIVG